ncbi:hypothetical protein QCA50_007627 [Cerrena zonata]|uniref:Uncharacterized protein n=1 Tax=Cerrena zonata TaxID=2478898 RepID=A0AAW0GHK4_9APHY
MFSLLRTTALCLLSVLTITAQAVVLERSTNITDLITLRSNTLKTHIEEALVHVPAKFNGQQVMTLATVTSVDGVFNSTLTLKNGTLIIPSGDSQGETISIVDGDGFANSDFSIVRSPSDGTSKGKLEFGHSTAFKLCGATQNSGTYIVRNPSASQFNLTSCKDTEIMVHRITF